MKKSLLFMMVIVLASLSAQAQMKVQSDGHISLGTLSGAWNVGTQVYPSGTVHFNHQSTEDWKWVTVASPNAVKGKCWIVTYPGDKYDHRFFVTSPIPNPQLLLFLLNYYLIILNIISLIFNFFNFKK